MNLLQLLEATAATEFRGWKGRVNGPYQIVVETSDFKPDGQYPGDRYDIFVNWGKTQKIEFGGNAEHAMDNWTPTRSSNREIERDNIAKRKKYADFRKFINSPGTKEKLFEFAKNVFAQALASGELGSWTRAYDYRPARPTDDAVIKGLLASYKKYGHEKIESYINAAKKLGFKVPTDITKAVKKSASSEKHTAKTEQLRRAVEAAQMRVDWEQKRLDKAKAALAAHEASEGSPRTPAEDEA